jgi:hypothetical protein
MRWQDLGRSGNVEDRRGLGPAGVAGGGIGAVVLAALGYFIFGIDPRTTMSVVNGQQGPAAAQQGQVGTPQDEQGQFMSAVLGSTEQVWTQAFRESGLEYRPTRLVLYDRATGTGCGTGQAAMGPFYCPADQRVYVDLTFFNELSTRFGAPGDFAQAYVIAHEVGHHVQHLLGADQQVRRAQAAGDTSGPTSAAVRLELQADCYAGVWAARVRSQQGATVLEPGDVQEGMRAAEAVGDDTLQRKAQGRVVPDSFTHGSSEQRMRWFMVGYETGDPTRCDTFRARTL